MNRPQFPFYCPYPYPSYWPQCPPVKQEDNAPHQNHNIAQIKDAWHIKFGGLPFSESLRPQLGSNFIKNQEQLQRQQHLKGERDQIKNQEGIKCEEQIKFEEPIKIEEKDLIKQIGKTKKQVQIKESVQNILPTEIIQVSQQSDYAYYSNYTETIVNIMKKRHEKQKLKQEQIQYNPMTEVEKKWLLFIFDYPPLDNADKEYVMNNISGMDPFFTLMIKTVIYKRKNYQKSNARVTQYLVNKAYQFYMRSNIGQNKILKSFRGNKIATTQTVNLILKQPPFAKAFHDYAALLFKEIQEDNMRKIEEIEEILTKNRSPNISKLMFNHLYTKQMPLSIYTKLRHGQCYLKILKEFKKPCGDVINNLQKQIMMIRNSRMVDPFRKIKTE